MPPLDDPSVRAAYEEQPEHLPRMSFGDHLEELRKRLWRSLLAVIASIFVMMPFHDGVMRIIVEPYRLLWKDAFRDYVVTLEKNVSEAKPGEISEDWGEKEWLRFCKANETSILDGTFPQRFAHTLPQKTGFQVPYQLMAVGGIEDLWTFMLAAFLFALSLSAPVVIWQAWAFIAAGLYAKERSIFYRYFPFMMVLLLAGVLFGYLVAVPYGLGYLIRMQVPGVVSSMLTVGNYFTFLFMLTTAMGLVFQLPLVMVALQRIGLVRHRTYIKQWRAFVLGIFAIAMVVTPPDPFSMIIMAMPMLVLFCLGLLLTAIGRRHESKEEAGVA
jgi:Tat protein translocase TatC